MEQYEPSESVRRMADAYERGLIGTVTDGEYYNSQPLVRSPKALEIVSNICVRCHKPIDDHQGLMGAGPQCEDMLR
jgi:hypothetical protein